MLNRMDRTILLAYATISVLAAFVAGIPGVPAAALAAVFAGTSGFTWGYLVGRLFGMEWDGKELDETNRD